NRPDGAGRPQGRLVPAVRDLKGLNEVLHIDQRPGTELGVQRPGLYELLDLEPAEPEAAVEVERLGAVDKPGPGCLDLATEQRVACDGAELDQGLPLVPPRGATGAIVAGERRERRGQRTGAPVGPEPEVDVERPPARAGDDLIQGVDVPVEVGPDRTFDDT